MNDIIIDENVELENIENDINSEEIIEEIIEVLLQLIQEYVEINPTILSCHDLDSTILDAIYEVVDITLEDIKTDNYVTYLDYDKYINGLELVEYSFELYNIMFNIKHTHKNNDLIEEPKFANKVENVEKLINISSSFEVDVQFIAMDDKTTMRQKIDYLRLKPQPEQRTNDWYKFRHNLITASNAHKALGTQSSINNLICDKCQPLKQVDLDNPDVVKSVNINSAMHHGQKYEPLSVMLYEHKYNTKIEDFGCIKHDEYDFMGASPDGINIDETSHLYGRMLEIKNVVSRVITGIPKKEYWIQMQLQMEVCDLDYCDFLETKFIEYESETDYLNDINTEPNRKGVILYFNTKSAGPHYIYKPLHVEDVDTWIDENIENCPPNMSWVKTIFWKLDTYSCILVERNRTWLQHNIAQFKSVWDTILKERVDGHEHRLPKKRVKPEDTMQQLMNAIDMEMGTSSKSIEGCCLLKTTTTT